MPKRPGISTWLPHSHTSDARRIELHVWCEWVEGNREEGRCVNREGSSCALAAASLPTPPCAPERVVRGVEVVLEEGVRDELRMW